MIICPDCGQTAPDEARFCEQCGRGLHDLPPPVVALEPLAAGAQLQGRFRIVELINQGSQENRYRAVSLDDPNRHLVLRERTGPLPPEAEPAEPQAEAAPLANQDPSGPTARTQDLTPMAPAAMAAKPSESESNLGGEGLQGLNTESQQSEAAPQETGVNGIPSGDKPEEPPATESETVRAGEETLDGQEPPAAEPAERADLGEVFERVLALSQTITHPAYHRALEGFAQDGRVYLVYADEDLKPFGPRGRSGAMREHEAVSAAIQICQAVSYLHNRGMRVNDICPASLAWGPGGRVKLTSLDYVSNDDELQAEPILNDGYTAPEIYRGKRVDKRADVFSIGCVLYTCLTGERIECETWREEAGPIRFYPPYVISPEVEKAVRRPLAFRPEHRWQGADQFKAELLKLGAQLGIRSGCATDVGMVREHNEDSVMALELMQDSQVSPARHYLYVVSDGMGGAEAGETASAIAVETIRYYVEEGVCKVRGSAQMQSAGGELANTHAPNPAAPLEQILPAALEQANRDIVAYQAAHPEARGMGATAVSALISPPDAAIAWVGDSRAYLLEKGRLRQLTKDHSLVQRLVDIGQITAEEARHHEHKNVITRSLGARANAPAGAESLRIRLKRGDRLLLCSDGLMAHVEDSAIAEILTRREDPVEATRELVAAANAGGGTDNISVIVIDAQ